MVSPTFHEVVTLRGLCGCNAGSSGWEKVAAAVFARWALNPSFLYPRGAGPTSWRVVARRTSLSEREVGANPESVCPSRIFACERPEDRGVEVTHPFRRAFWQLERERDGDAAAVDESDWVEFDRVLVPREGMKQSVILETVRLERNPLRRDKLRISFVPRVSCSPDASAADLRAEVFADKASLDDVGERFASFCSQRKWRDPQTPSDLPPFYLPCLHISLEVALRAGDPASAAASPAKGSCGCQVVATFAADPLATTVSEKDSTTISKVGLATCGKFENWCRTYRAELFGGTEEERALSRVRKKASKRSSPNGASAAPHVFNAIHDLSEKFSWLSRENVARCYSLLKKKYGKYWVDNWDESSDAQKSVYEDLSIAATLMVLWRGSADSARSGSSDSTVWPPRFVDIGSGNGFLVYILASEGFPGCGIDPQRRKIWDRYRQSEDDPALLYPPIWKEFGLKDLEPVVLKDQLLDLFASEGFGEADWILGNHSDECTPWIPVIAAKSGARSAPGRIPASFFVLPCCFFELNGQRFEANNPRLGKYRTYMKFLHELSEEFSFSVYAETLKIPSPKSQALVGIPNAGNLLTLEEIEGRLSARGIRSSADVTLRKSPQELWRPPKVPRRYGGERKD